MKLRLVPDWHQAWKWSSVRLMALSGSIQTALVAFPTTLSQYIPQHILSTLSTISLVILVLAGLGRVTEVEKHNEPKSPPAA